MVSKYIVTVRGGLFYVGLYTRELVDGTPVEKIDIQGEGDWMRQAVEKTVAELNSSLPALKDAAKGANALPITGPFLTTQTPAILC